MAVNWKSKLRSIDPQCMRKRSEPSFNVDGMYVETECGTVPHALHLVHSGTVTIVVPQREETSSADLDAIAVNVYALAVNEPNRHEEGIS